MKSDHTGLTQANRPPRNPVRFTQLSQVTLGGEEIAVESAQNFRKLRARGVTIRGTIDVIIATRCLSEGFRLLHSDRDFDAFEEHLGLQVVACGA
jgi:predicted nucleic acid-binding protein